MVQPCLWGNPADGLEPPVLLSGVTIKVVAITNSTYAHHGEVSASFLPCSSRAVGADDARVVVVVVVLLVCVVFLNECLVTRRVCVCRPLAAAAAC
jgi:hypothetical protein